MTNIVRDRNGERDEAGPNESAEEEKDLRRKLNRGKP